MACMGERRGIYRVLVEKKNPRRRAHLEHVGVDGKIILKWIFKKKNGG